jgi:hypothetical protein
MTNPKKFSRIAIENSRLKMVLPSKLPRQITPHPDPPPLKGRGEKNRLWQAECSPELLLNYLDPKID